MFVPGAEVLRTSRAKRVPRLRRMNRVQDCLYSAPGILEFRAFSPVHAQRKALTRNPFLPREAKPLSPAAALAAARAALSAVGPKNRQGGSKTALSG